MEEKHTHTIEAARDPIQEESLKINAILRAFQKNITAISLEEQKARDELVKLLSGKEDLLREKQSLERKAGEYEQDQATFAETEEFDKADLLTPMIDQLKSRISNLEEKSLRLSVKIDEVGDNLHTLTIHKENQLTTIVPRLEAAKNASTKSFSF